MTTVFRGRGCKGQAPACSPRAGRTREEEKDRAGGCPAGGSPDRRLVGRHRPGLRAEAAVERPCERPERLGADRRSRRAPRRVQAAARHRAGAPEAGRPGSAREPDEAVRAGDREDARRRPPGAAAARADARPAGGLRDPEQHLRLLSAGHERRHRHHAVRPDRQPDLCGLLEDGHAAVRACRDEHDLVGHGRRLPDTRTTATRSPSGTRSRTAGSSRSSRSRTAPRTARTSSASPSRRRPTPRARGTATSS